MFTVSSRSRRSSIAVAVVATAAVFSGLTPASAAPGVSVQADGGTWGTGPAPNGRAQLATAVVETDGRAYIGGAFSKMVPPGGGSSVKRNRLAALDVKRKTLLPWNPNANGVVRALALNRSKTAVYVGGDFSAIGGKSVSKLALVDLASGRVDARFRPAVKGRVRSVALAGDRLYAGGDFTRVSSSARAEVAALDPTTGALLDWKPPALGAGRYLGQTGVPTADAPAGHVYGLAGTSRRHLAAFDAATGALDGWNPRANTSTGPWGAAVTAGHLVVVGEFTTINGQRRPGYAQFARGS